MKIDDSIFLDKKLEEFKDCPDIQAYLLTLCESQRIKFECATQLRSESLSCCGISNIADLSIPPMSDTITNYRIKVYKLGNRNTLVTPEFVLDASGESFFQESLDFKGYTQCVINYKISTRVCIISRLLDNSAGGSGPDQSITIEPDLPAGGLGGEDVEVEPDELRSAEFDEFTSSNMVSGSVDTTYATLPINVYCQGVIVDTITKTIQIDLDIENNIPSTGLCVDTVIDIPFEYAQGDCDVDTISFEFDGDQGVVTPREDDNYSHEIRTIYVNGIDVCAECLDINACFLDLKTLVPPTGICADPRLFFVGYEYNQKLIVDTYNEAYASASRCCDLEGNSTNDNFCMQNTPFDTSNGIDYLLNGFISEDNTQPLGLTIALLSQQQCFFEFSGEYEMCAESLVGIDDELLINNNIQIIKNIQLYCGPHLIDTATVIIYPAFDGTSTNACGTRTFSFEMFWEAAGDCNLSDLRLRFGQSILDEDLIEVSSEQINAICMTSRCE